MTFSLEQLINFLFSEYSLLYVEFFSLIVKIYVVSLLIDRARRAGQFDRSLLYLLGIVVSGAIVDLSWLLKLFRELFYLSLNRKIVIFVIRIAWGFNLLLFQFLGLLLDNLSTKYFRLSRFQKLIFAVNFVFILIFFGISTFNFNNILENDRSVFEYVIIKITSLSAVLLTLPSLLLMVFRLRKDRYPRILKKQLKLLIQFLITPYLAFQILETIFIIYDINTFGVNIFSAPLLTAAIFYTIKKILRLRFLNFTNHVQDLSKSFNFIEDFRTVIDRLSYARSLSELDSITRHFFSEAFELLPARSHLYIRSVELRSPNIPKQLGSLGPIEQEVEKFLDQKMHNKACVDILRETRILITDELAFSNFYQAESVRGQLVQFLESLNLDIFLPIFERNMLIGYITVERFSRADQFYNETERDEMLVFVRYLSSIINLLENRNLNLLIKKEKELREELHIKHHEIAQFKESMRTFLRTAQHRSIGIVIYKNRKFTYVNQIAKEMLEVNLNRDAGDSLTKRLSSLVQQVEVYKTTQSSMVTDSKGERLVITALPHIEHNSIIITVHYPEIADMVRSQVELLKNPSEWDYLLYLETTQSGQVINKLLPGVTGPLLNYKIELLKAALSPKALLLNLPEDDLMQTAEIIHHISMRQLLHVFTLQPYHKPLDVASALFGLNTLIQEQNQRPLLEKLDKIGTLCIQNIHLLDMELQEQLAEFIQYGYFTTYRGEHRTFSDVRIICSTNQDLSALVATDRFSRNLLDQLRATTVAMPSLLNLSEDDMEVLVEGFTQQAFASRTYKNLLELSPKERQKLIADRPVSVREFRKKVLHRLVDKSRKNALHHEAHFDPAYSISDPALAEAARFGKKALKDSRIMSMLWNKFQNQNKIALFLGVNRSSINRRLKEFNIIQPDTQ